MLCFGGVGRVEVAVKVRWTPLKTCSVQAYIWIDTTSRCCRSMTRRTGTCILKRAEKKIGHIAQWRFILATLTSMLLRKEVSICILTTSIKGPLSHAIDCAEILVTYEIC